ncbi:uncharacterized protein [Nicotiana tomentosiformis]|uniref:uncharacterized protein n=1 Tax=Nicotiana tomentosiformis TaxID=4098 RepID=UPI00388C560F
MGKCLAHPACSTATTSAAPPPTQGTQPTIASGAVRGGTECLGGPSHFYVIRGRQISEASPDIVTGILTIQSHFYALIDPGSTLSYVTPYVAKVFAIEPEQLHEIFSVSAPVGESIMATRVYRDYLVTARGRDTMVDLIELEMGDFYVIMGMDWLYSWFAKLDGRTKTVRFEFPNESVIE